MKDKSGTSISWLMSYSRRPRPTLDRLGGLPQHLPYNWPRCQLCQERMAFVGQLYASERLPMHDHLALQFYVCDDCRKDIPLLTASHAVRKGATKSVATTLHLEALPRRATFNKRGIGVRCKRQPKMYITYEPKADSLDRQTFMRRRMSENELPDKHLRRDKIGGLFPYDGYEAPKQTAQNQTWGQFTWPGIGGTVYLYRSARGGFYPYHYH